MLGFDSNQAKFIHAFISSGLICFMIIKDRILILLHTFSLSEIEGDQQILFIF